MPKHADIILAGDIGGTHARFGCLTRTANDGWRVENFVKVKGEDFPTFDAVLGAYLDGLDVRPTRAAFAAAGPVRHGKIKLTNMAWDISSKRAKDIHGFEACELYNDFAGMTRSVPELQDDDFDILRSARPDATAPILVAGAGTGFGVGYLVPVLGNAAPARWQVVSTEGGHVAYAPQTALEFELLLALQKTHDYVSLELVSSGKGLPAVHKAMCDIHGQAYSFMAPELISEQALSGDVICADIIRVRANAVMGAIGDLALAGGARGGIVLAGGVSTRMSDFYLKPEAMSRYLSRGPQSAYVKDIPIRLLTSPMAPLIGAAALLSDLKS